MLKVPCQKCINCRIARTAEWSTRLLHEMHYYPDDQCYFITLTYDEDHFPPFGSLSKRHLLNFVQTLKRHTNSPNLKYFMTGEYGDETFRPHYHLILLGLDVDTTDITDVINSCWKKGLIDVGTVTAESIQYTCGYVQKKYSGEKALEEYGEYIEPPFQLQSNGIGKKWLVENKNKPSVLTDGIKIHGKPRSFPRYYKKLLEKDGSDFKYYLQKKAFDAKKEYYEKLDQVLIDNPSFSAYNSDVQRDLTTKKATELFKKNKI
ncbi:MAG: hypothetical protein Ta2B_10550 [Termitinemataceae bacterium]|nr:MAG: hypothetical protein Ta2B_10550 [Termitinemataceae bacterium]